jgi:hypothetical protein
MRPKQQKSTDEGDLFRARLDQIIDMTDELVRLAGKLDWARALWSSLGAPRATAGTSIPSGICPGSAVFCRHTPTADTTRFTIHRGYPRSYQ